ncbi:MAG: hypothetical protein RL077_3209, partial [Verrucomicrobiota bacterium]
AVFIREHLDCRALHRHPGVVQVVAARRVEHPSRHGRTTGTTSGRWRRLSPGAASSGGNEGDAKENPCGGAGMTYREVMENCRPIASRKRGWRGEGFQRRGMAGFGRVSHKWVDFERAAGPGAGEAGDLGWPDLWGKARRIAGANRGCGLPLGVAIIAEGRWADAGLRIARSQGASVLKNILRQTRRRRLVRREAWGRLGRGRRHGRRGGWARSR